jgi:hypothetical protein
MQIQVMKGVDAFDVWYDDKFHDVIKGYHKFIHHSSYCYMIVDKKPVIMHRWLWGLDNENIPSMLDHINRDKSDNRLINLRETDAHTNLYNRHMTNKHGKLVGAYYHKLTDKWVSRIKVHKSLLYLGSYNTELQAHDRYIQERRSLGIPDPFDYENWRSQQN